MIELLDHQGNDNSVANVARVSFAGEDWANLPKDYSIEKRDSLIRFLAKHKHVSPFRHNSISIRCEMPIFIVRQLAKHQAGLSWNEVSRRYVSDGITFFRPEKWRNAPTGNIKQGSSGVYQHNEYLKTACDIHNQQALDFYNTIIEDGVAPEMARMVLPQSMNTKWVWTGNLLAFAHIYKERIASNAQVETQEFAKELDTIIRPLFPVSWESLVGSK